MRVQTYYIICPSRTVSEDVIVTLVGLTRTIYRVVVKGIFEIGMWILQM